MAIYLLLPTAQPSDPEMVPALEELRRKLIPWSRIWDDLRRVFAFLAWEQEKHRKSDKKIEMLKRKIDAGFEKRGRQEPEEGF